MSKSIYEEAQKNVKWLRDYILDVFYNERILSDHIQRSTEDLDIIKITLEKAQKQEKLLTLYKELSHYVDYIGNWDKITQLKIKIKELENEKNI